MKAVKRKDLNQSTHIPIKTETGTEKYILLNEAVPSIQLEDISDQEYNTILEHPTLGTIYAQSIDLDFIENQ